MSQAMTVPLLDVNAQNLPVERELTEAFQRVLRSGQFIMGNEVAALEEELGQWLGVKNVLGVSSGTDAILLALMALEIGPGAEVLCPAYTFFATAGCVARVGATPVFVDSDPATFNLDPADLARKISSRSRALMPVHLFGQCAAMDEIMAVARAHNLPVIEDAAQSLGARHRAQPAGSFGAFGAYSFFPSKNLGALGDAGLLAGTDGEWAEKARWMRIHGSQTKYYHRYVGGNFRLDALQAAFLRVKLRHYESYTSQRQRNAARYLERLRGIPGVVSADQPEASASQSARLILPAVRPENTHIWNQFTLRVPGRGRRDSLRAFLQEGGIGCEIYYPVPLHQQECFARSHERAGGACPVAERLAGEALSIPIYPELTEAQQNRVAGRIIEFLQP